MQTLKKVIAELFFRSKIIYYNLQKEIIQKRVFKKQRIKVVFFVLYDNMWKSDGLFKLLLNSERFEPYIISSPYPRHPKKFGAENQERVEQFFKKKGFPFFKGYDFERGEWFDIKSLNPDIVFYQQPYNSGYAGFKIEGLWKDTLFGYIPYTYELEDNPAMLHHLLLNVAWRVFLPSSFEVKVEGQHLYNGGRNLVASGYPLADTLLSLDFSEGQWKVQDTKLKRVIWAPHHSILDSDFLNYSNFLEIAEDMLKLTDKYKDTIQFAFKPHPVLKRKLYKLDGWGEEKTDAYYNQWACSENTTLVEGDYVDLFKSSDSLIHDCSTFTAEYLYTKKPVMYLSKPGKIDCFNEFGKKCYEQHYIGHSVADIDRFLQSVVLEGNDTMKEARDCFFSQYLMPPKGKSVAQNMYDEFEKALLPIK